MLQYKVQEKIKSLKRNVGSQKANSGPQTPVSVPPQIRARHRLKIAESSLLNCQVEGAHNE
jgi:hypothetical protein